MVSKEQVEQDQGGADAEAVQGRTRYMRRGLTEEEIRKLKLNGNNTNCGILMLASLVKLQLDLKQMCL